MIKLSPRMKAIANQVLLGQSVADIGTDHAYIPIYLFENKLSPKIILTDRRKGPLEKASAHLQDVGLSDELNDLRMGNGLSVLAPAEVDAVVIAGMGGLLIAEILAEDIDKSYTFSRFILQPRTASSSLRAWLVDNRFSIIGEHLAKEGNRICEIITAVPAVWGVVGEEFSEEIDFEVPPMLFMGNDPLLEIFLRDKISKTQKVLHALEQAGSNGFEKRKRSLKQRINVLNERKMML